MTNHEAKSLDTAVAVDFSEQSRSGRTGNHDIRIENPQEQLIALFHDESYKERGTVLAQESPE